MRPPDGDKPQHCVVVSLQKAGTHLMGEIMKAFGFEVCGTIRPDPDSVDRPPRMSEEEVRWIVSESRSPSGTSVETAAEDQFTEAWPNFYWNMCRYMGIDVQRRYTKSALRGYRRKLETISLLHSPKNICWFLHGLSVEGGSRDFLNEWVNGYRFPMVFNVRDPRDILISYVDYLTGKTKHGFGNYSDYLIYSGILGAMKTRREQLLFAIEDPFFPGKKMMRESLWLSKHPDVLVVRFEDLVGDRGGGDNQRQQAALDQLATHVNRSFDSSYEVFNTNSFTFNTGQAQRWKEIFDDDLKARFHQAHSHELEQLGYA